MKMIDSSFPCDNSRKSPTTMGLLHVCTSYLYLLCTTLWGAGGRELTLRFAQHGLPACAQEGHDPLDAGWDLLVQQGAYAAAYLEQVVGGDVAV